MALLFDDFEHSLNALLIYISSFVSALESFIRAKYEQKKYLAREWVQPKPAVPKEVSRSV